MLNDKILQDHSRQTLEVSQETYLRKVLERFNTTKAKPIEHLSLRTKALTLKDCPKTLAGKAKMITMSYASAIGSLMYAMVCT